MSRVPFLFLALAALAACRPAPPEPEAPVLPEILLVTLDTTRADAMGYESGADDTPELDALAGRGRVYEAAYATAPMTLPSHTSMLTGLYPAEHGIHENARYLPESHVLAAERLREAGYVTAAFVSA